MAIGWTEVNENAGCETRVKFARAGFRYMSDADERRCRHSRVAGPDGRMDQRQKEKACEAFC
jgi:hypothetical protein